MNENWKMWTELELLPKSHFSATPVNTCSLNFWHWQCFLCFKVQGADHSLTKLMGIYYHKYAKFKTCSFVSGLSFSKINFNFFFFKSHDSVELFHFLLMFSATWHLIKLLLKNFKGKQIENLDDCKIFYLYLYFNSASNSVYYFQNLILN